MQRDLKVLLAIVGVALTSCGWFAPSATQSKTFIGIAISANNLSPLLIERRIVLPVENELRRHQKVHRINVNIVEGFVCFQVWFDSDHDPNPALVEVTAAVKRIAPAFPDATREFLIETVEVGTKENFCTPSIQQTDETT